MIDGHTRVVVSERASQAIMDGEAVVLNQETGEFYSLNPIGARIFDLAMRGSDVASIINALTTEYSASRDEVSANLETYLGELQAIGLITLVPGIEERSP